MVSTSRRPAEELEYSSWSELLQMTLRGVSPPAGVFLGFRRWLASVFFDTYNALCRVGVELGVRERLVRQSDAGIVPGVLWFFEGTSSRDDPGPERGPADGRLATHVELPAADVAALVDLLEGEQGRIVVGSLLEFGRRYRRAYGRIIECRHGVGGSPGGFRHHRPHDPKSDAYHQALQREHKPGEPDHLVLPTVLMGSLPLSILSTFGFYLLGSSIQEANVVPATTSSSGEPFCGYTIGDDGVLPDLSALQNELEYSRYPRDFVPP
jgi:hypothetical protein